MSGAVSARVLRRRSQTSVKNILVAIDECESVSVASPIMRRAIEMATAFSSKVWILHIVPHPGDTVFNVDRQLLRREIRDEMRNEHEHLHRLAQCLRDRQIQATALLVEGGGAARMILEESNRLDADLIILGCHTHTLIYSVLAEGTEEGLLSRCSRPILFVPDRPDQASKPASSNPTA
jgi:nucleotide-binding universal stress UspA family protein